MHECSYLRSGAILYGNRFYSPYKSRDDTVFLKHLKDLEKGIAYCKAHEDWKVYLDTAETSRCNYDWSIRDYRDIKKGKYIGRPVSTGFRLGIKIKITDVIKNRAIGVVIEKKYPWITPRPGDVLHLSQSGGLESRLGNPYW